MFFIYLKSFAFIFYLKKINRVEFVLEKDFNGKKQAIPGRFNFLWKFTDQHVIVLCFTDI